MISSLCYLFLSKVLSWINIEKERLKTIENLYDKFKTETKNTE